MKRFRLLRGNALGFNTPQSCHGMHERTQVRDARSARQDAPHSLLRVVASLAALIITAFLISACDGELNALIHLNGKVYYSTGSEEGVLNKKHKEALNSLLSNVETSILSENAQSLSGEERIRFYNDKRDIVVSFNNNGDEYYIYSADILDGTEHSKRYYSVPADTAAFMEDIIRSL